jgi:L-amino acid N-acyltransferase YncA
LLEQQARERWFAIGVDCFVVLLNQSIVGFYFFTPWRKGKKSLEATRELSFYLDTSFHGKGLGKQMLNLSIQSAKQLNIETLIAILLEINTRSRQLLEVFEFKLVGHLPDIAKLPSGNSGQYIMMKKLND